MNLGFGLTGKPQLAPASYPSVRPNPNGSMVLAAGATAMQSPWTRMFFIRRDGSTGGGDQTMMGQDDGGTGGYNYAYFQINNDLVSFYIGLTNFPGLLTLPDATWYQFAVTSDGTNVTIYAAPYGSPLAVVQPATPFTLAINGGPVWMLDDAYGEQASPVLSLGPVREWSVYKNAAGVIAESNSDTAVNPANLRYEYLNRGVANAGIDSSGNGLNATVNGTLADGVTQPF